MFTRSRARIANAINVIAAAFGLGLSRGPVQPTATAEPPRFTPPSQPRDMRNKARKARVSTFWGFGGRARTQVGEMARRVRQIEAGFLTPSNGLVLPTEGGWLRRANSHGQMMYSV